MRTVSRVLLVTVALVGVGAAGWWWRSSRTPQAPQYRTAIVEQSDLRASVAATGVLSAVRTVEVGTQVSGQIAELYVDFNDRVRRGQLIARIDPTLQQQAVQEAEAALTRAEAQRAQTEDEFARTSTLHDGGFVTQAEFTLARTNRTLAVSTVTSAKVALERARQNLSYTSIHAPIDGVVIERSIDVGQTVAASLSAPRLFVIANDLTRMQILALVDESDIGRIRAGQAVEFTVQAFPSRPFSGVVETVRLASTTANNVVSYTVVVKVNNPDGKLLPGMTATVNFVTGEATNVFTVPNTALRFRPSSSSATPRSGGARDRAGSIYTLRGDSLVMLPVRVGLTDGTRTAVSGEGLTAGLSVVIGTTVSTSAPGAAASPFQQPQQQGSQRRGGPPTPF
jgi:HlyD family secretion protein